MRPLTRCFEVDVFFQLHVGPEIDELNTTVGRANAVYSTESLDNANRVPMDVVVDEKIAVLEILAFRNAIRGDE